MKLEEFKIEEWCKEFEKACKKPMNDEQGKLMFTLLLNQDQIDGNEEFTKEIDNAHSLSAVLKKRIEAGPFTYSLTNSAFVFIESILDNFGTSTMICAYLQYISHKTGKNVLGLNEICKDAFPLGFPGEEDLQKLWDKQKIQGVPDNALDYNIYGPVIENP